MTKKNILITGGTGLIGSVLIKKLYEKGFNCFILTTSAVNDRPKTYKWNPELHVCDMLPNVEYYAVINLAGASIADTKWNPDGIEQISFSRIDSTNYLKTIISAFPHPPKHVISASAIGYYGFETDEIKTEDSPNGHDFAAKVCRDWEQAASNLKTNDTQLSILRIGIVLAQKGGFYKKIKDLAKYKIAAPLASGKQPVSWIHVEDLVNLFIEILENKIAPSTYNAVANTNTNKEVTKSIASKNGQPFVLPAVPEFLLKLIFGKKAEMFTRGSIISNSKLKKEGFQFKYSDLNKAVSELTNR